MHAPSSPWTSVQDGSSAWNTLLPPPLSLIWGWASLLPNPPPSHLLQEASPHFTPELGSTFSVSGSGRTMPFMGTILLMVG